MLGATLWNLSELGQNVAPTLYEELVVSGAQVQLVSRALVSRYGVVFGFVDGAGVIRVRFDTMPDAVLATTGYPLNPGDRFILGMVEARNFRAIRQDAMDATLRLTYYQ